MYSVAGRVTAGFGVSKTGDWIQAPNAARSIDFGKSWIDV